MTDPGVLEVLRGGRFASRLLIGFVALVGVTLVGCGSTNHPVVPVKGTIAFLDGQPLPEGTRLVLRPLQGDRQGAEGKVGSDKAFTMTHLSGSSGAEVGQYKLAIIKPKGYTQDFTRVVPEEYIDGDGFKLVEIKEGMPELNLTVRRPRPRW